MSELEKQLAAIWGEVLGCGIVSVDDDYFELGGDSLLAIQIVSRFHEAGHSLTIDTLFEHRTIARSGSSLIK